MGPIIELPPTAVSDILASTSQIFVDLSPILFLVVGVLLGVLVITFLIRVLHR